MNDLKLPAPLPICSRKAQVSYGWSMKRPTRCTRAQSGAPWLRHVSRVPSFQPCCRTRQTNCSTMASFPEQGSRVCNKGIARTIIPAL